MNNNHVYLKKDKIAFLNRKHPWIFSGAIQTKSETITEGDIVFVKDANNKTLATGHYHDTSIAIRILRFGPDWDPDTFWKETIGYAFQLRKHLGLVDNPNCNAYRLIHGEGDNLSGLIIDIYNETAVIQCHTIGMHKSISQISAAIQFIYAERIKHIYDKSRESLPSQYSAKMENAFLLGDKQEEIICEHGVLFKVNIVEGQKTGFFLDQRLNRFMCGQYAKDTNLLNAFCYTGGFSMYALQQGASHVTSIDQSQRALDVLEQNLLLNNIASDRHTSLKKDVIHYLQEIDSQSFDVIILDPPAFAKSIDKRHQAVQAYKRINIEAMQKIKKGGLLFSFSCSQVVTRELFYNTLVSAGIDSNRNVQILHQCSQGPDHPINAFHPEGEYLKGLVMRIN